MAENKEYAMKNAMVWGAAGGIGRALVAELVAQGWRVFAVSRAPDMLTDLTPYSLDADVVDAFGVQNAVMAAGYEVDAIDMWVYAVGDIEVARVADVSTGTWQRIMDANLNGAFMTTHQSLPLLASDAHLFYLGAVTERLKLPGFAPYVAAKAGLEAFADTLRKEQRSRKVTIVRPGAVNTPFWEKVPVTMPRDAAAPDKVARRILEAYGAGHSGNLDLI